jgi:hypothetical protein
VVGRDADLHLYGVSAEDIAAILGRENCRDRT